MFRLLRFRKKKKFRRRTFIWAWLFLTSATLSALVLLSRVVFTLGSHGLLSIAVSNGYFSSAGLVKGDNGVIFFVNGRTCALLTNFWECGKIYGDLREHLPFFGSLSSQDLSIIGKWPTKVSNGSLHNAAPVFRCSQHTNYPLIVAKRANIRHWMIISPARFNFLADLFANVLQTHKFTVTISAELPDAHTDFDMYIVISTIELSSKMMPPANKRIVAQMDSMLSVATSEYMTMLRESEAVLDFSLNNIQLLRARQIDDFRLWHLHLGIEFPSKRVAGMRNKWDLIYLEDVTSDRTSKFLRILDADYRVKIVHEANYDSILVQQSRFTLSLCRSPTASLDMTLISRSLTLGVPVIAESCATDAKIYTETLKSTVFFFHQGSVSSMTSVVKEALRLSSAQQTRYIESVVASSARRFAHTFNRVLFGIGSLPLSMFEDIFTEPPELQEIMKEHSESAVVLSLPESPERRMYDAWPESFSFSRFYAVRLLTRPSWISTGLSYKAIASTVLNNGGKQIIIAEDDMRLPVTHQHSYGVIRDYLDSITEWDVFSGLIADVHPNTKVISAECHLGIQFVTIDRMTSMVYNIYKSKALRAMSTWNPLDDNQRTNTIDRYLERMVDLRVVCTLPFYAGHAQGFSSTIWEGVGNNAYEGMIAQSEKKMHGLLKTYLLNRNRVGTANHSESCNYIYHHGEFKSW